MCLNKHSKKFFGESMKKFIVLPDLTCDLSEEIREYVNLNDYVTGYTQINGESIVTRLDWSQISREDFYNALANKKNRVSSAAPNPEDYHRAFSKYAKEGYDILSMSISSKISSTYSVATVSAKKVMEEYPDCKIYCFDSLRMSGAFGLLVMYASEMQNAGKSMDEIISWLEENKLKVHQMGPIDDLTFIARRGKISKGKAFMGNLIGIKPMGDCNKDGYVTVLGKAKGIKNALTATVKYLKELAVDVENQYILISHSDREKIAFELKEKIESEIKCKKLFVSDVYSGCGTNIGPGMIGVYFLGETVSDECEKEKAVLLNALENL